MELARPERSRRAGRAFSPMPSTTHTHPELGRELMDEEYIRQIKTWFDEFRRGLTELQADAARGDLDAVHGGLVEAIASVNELEQTIDTLLETLRH